MTYLLCIVEYGTATPVVTESISSTVVISSVAGGVLLFIVSIIGCIIAIALLTTKRKRGYDHTYIYT